MSKRGVELREHILWSAKEVFLEMGFERASMDEIASRAETSKRTLYAHFENKENLYLAIVDLVREIYRSKLKSPGDYSDDATEALVMFCGRYLEGLLFVWTIRMCRMSIAEAERFPEGSSRYFDAVFSDPQELLADYMTATFQLSESASSASAQKLLGRITYPRFQRALFGLDPLSEEPIGEAINPSFDISFIREAVADFVNSL